jgi:4-hydroxy-tetrahydrodipicolinate synthase
MFEGVFTALVTPFTQSGAIDTTALKRLIDEQLAGGVQGIVAVGTTGESPTVSHEENIKIIELIVDQVAGRRPVIAGSGSNSTAEALDLTQKAKAIGANGSLQVTPYYNKPNQEGLYRHFSTVADGVDLPMILYNIPGRSAKLIETATILRLAKHQNIVGIKQTVDTLGQCMEIVGQAAPDFVVLAGDDAQTLPVMALGGRGVISVASNIVPAEMVALYQALATGNAAQARTIHYRLLPLFADLGLDTNPIPIKYALYLQGKIAEAYRLPLYPMADDQKAKLRATLQALKLVI